MLFREMILSGAICVGALVSTPQGAAAQDRWQGYYAGLSLDSVDVGSNVGSNATHVFSERSAALGAYAGYNFVRDNGFVWGPELALTGLSASGTATDVALGTSDFQGSFLFNPRVRLGYATDRVFFYGMLGLGFTDAGVQPFGNSGTDIVVSGSIGIGAEFALSDRWSTKIEAVHYDWNDVNRSFNGVGQGVDTDVTQITLGLTRKF